VGESVVGVKTCIHEIFAVRVSSTDLGNGHASLFTECIMFQCGQLVPLVARALVASGGKRLRLPYLPILVGATDDTL
jgi:hypothetical protein